MKKIFQPKNLPVLVLISGLAGLMLHWLTYFAAVDEKNLLVAHHPVVILLGLLSASVAALIAAVTVKLDGTGDYQENFRPSVLGTAGSLGMALCILATVLFQSPAMLGKMGSIWRWTGILAAASLTAVGFCRLRGKAPFFALHLAVCLFYAVHILSHYQSWSGTPQIQDYVFALLGTLALMLYTYYQMAFDVGFARRRMLLGMGMAAMYLCTVALYDTPYKLLYLGSIAWVWSSLCAFRVHREKKQ